MLVRVVGERVDLRVPKGGFYLRMGCLLFILLGG